MEIRRATNGDWAAVSNLMQLQNRFHVDLVGHIVKQVPVSGVDDWCRAQLSDDAVAIFLAEDEGAGPAGLVMISIRRYEESAMTHGVELAFIDELFVVPAARRKGYAARLIGHVKEFASSKGLSAVSLNVWGANTNAVAAYAALGFDTVYQRMTVALD